MTTRETNRRPGRINFRYISGCQKGPGTFDTNYLHMCYFFFRENIIEKGFSPELVEYFKNLKNFDDFDKAHKFTLELIKKRNDYYLKSRNDYYFRLWFSEEKQIIRTLEAYDSTLLSIVNKIISFLEKNLYEDPNPYVNFNENLESDVDKVF